MPVRVAQFDNQARPFKEPEAARPPETQQLGTTERNWRVIRDLEEDLSTLEVVKDEGKVHIYEIDLMMEKYVLERYTYKGDDFSSVCGEVLTKRGLSRGDWKVKTVTRTVMHSDAENFYLRADLDAYESGFRVYCKSWGKTIPRKFV